MVYFKVKIKTIWESTLHLVYPNVCFGCYQPLLLSEPYRICSSCLTQIEKTYFHQKPFPNDMEAKLLGFSFLKRATALFYFDKKGALQNIIHSLKYENKPFLGVHLGMFLAHQLKNDRFFENIDYIVPVPMHPQKERTRGYNQAMMIVKGIQRVVSIPYSSDILVKVEHTLTQTRKNKLQRLISLSSKSIFTSLDPQKIRDKSILLVDDIITTGSTLIKCMEILEQYGCKACKIVTVGMAR
ncbi:MAG: phosphoribosyltransferase family protein [Bacteroidia bacterium]|nr:phosphoribosyltransferase family protein [Bacteroidia bacterium]